MKETYGHAAAGLKCIKLKKLAATGGKKKEIA
jgi:hypothetical protein